MMKALPPNPWSTPQFQNPDFCWAQPTCGFCASFKTKKDIKDKRVNSVHYGA